MLKIFRALTALIFSFCSIAISAQNDAAGCGDHILFTRMSGYSIEACSENYNAVPLPTSKNDDGYVQTDWEGTVTAITYYSSAEKLPTGFQLIKNYESAIISKGGKKIFSYTGSGLQPVATFYIVADGMEHWVGITNMIGVPSEGISAYRLTIISNEAMVQEIDVNAMTATINAGNALTLYINFETERSDIKTESGAVVDALYKMLHDNPALKITIEGHTDNVGDALSNQALSEQRAISVKAALTNKGIDSGRILTTGFGQDKPLSDNATEEGRAKNRRVEIRKV